LICKSSCCSDGSTPGSGGIVKRDFGGGKNIKTAEQQKEDNSQANPQFSHATLNGLGAQISHFCTEPSCCFANEDLKDAAGSDQKN